ncbi:MAG: hypothetical protein QF752_05980 [Planctomycetota bacterium]|nr:hypothetical protein [Planctomycetota bacterium]
MRGAIEAGVGYATGYPGTPSSEITDGFAALAEHAEIHFEYGINEKTCAATNQVGIEVKKYQVVIRDPFMKTGG